MLRVMIRDVAVSRRAYGSSDYHRDGLSSGKRNTRIVTISSGRVDSETEIAKQVNDDDSDKGILEDGDASKRGRILQTNDFQIQYDRRDVEKGR